jgi:C4-dicarboxylate-specific signal transduction histidine kinase
LGYGRRSPWPVCWPPSPSRGSRRFYLQRAGAADTATLRLATEVLRGALERTEALPALIAERPILAQLLRDPENDGAGAVHQ